MRWLKAARWCVLVWLATGILPAALAQEGTEPVPETALPPVPAANPLKAQDEIRTAYQKEYALLETQIRELEQMISAFDSTSRESEQSKEAAIDKVESEYTELQSRGERFNDLLTEAERQIENAENSRTTLEATFLQAGATLEPFGLAALRTEEYLASQDIEKLDQLFAETLALLRDLGKVRRTSGSFFLEDGTEVSGTLVHIGNIASYGVAGGRGGALAPAGENQFKVWAASRASTAAALAEGRGPDTIDVFLYETSQKAIEERAGKTLIGEINSGGTIAWIIVGLGVIAALLAVLRFLFLRGASASTGRVAQDVGRLVRDRRLDEALKACKELKGSTARVVASAVRNLGRDREHIEDIVSEQILHESAHLNRFGSLIILIAAVSPLLGLLGTVTGMIATFDIITEFGTGDPKLLSSGIAIALVTTEVGLAVAIPALIVGNLLSGWAESVKDDMEKAALHVMNLYKDKPATAGAAA